ncbi:MAG: hypothetical protein KDC27_16665, partial [Acidobacteria bacterium]|nr:hypothetical protein [Acidobacteriota bacterium]
GEGEPRIAAYVAARAGAGLDAERLRRELSERLPDYMIPSSFTVLEAFPLTINGKLDYEKLPAATPESAGRPVAPPSNDAERVVAAIFAEALERPVEGVDDDFFMLGGHSLAAARVVALVRDLFQTPLPLARVYERPTVAGVVAALVDAMGDPETVERIACEIRNLSEAPAALSETSSS